MSPLLSLYRTVPNEGASQRASECARMSQAASQDGDNDARGIGERYPRRRVSFADNAHPFPFVVAAPAVAPLKRSVRSRSRRAFCRSLPLPLSFSYSVMSGNNFYFDRAKKMESRRRERERDGNEGTRKSRVSESRLVSSRRVALSVAARRNAEHGMARTKERMTHPFPPRRGPRAVARRAREPRTERRARLKCNPYIDAPSRSSSSSSSSLSPRREWRLPALVALVCSLAWRECLHGLGRDCSLGRLRLRGTADFSRLNGRYSTFLHHRRRHRRRRRVTDGATATVDEKSRTRAKPTYRALSRKVEPQNRER